MLSLRELQIKFNKAMSGSADADLLAVLLQNTDRLQLYQNMISENYVSALKNIYPTILSLLGEECFSGMANAYQNKYPSMSGNLNNYGMNFSEFIKTFAAAETLPYLSEVAQLDWAYQKAFYAKNTESLIQQKLVQIDEKNYQDLKFILNDSVSLLKFSYPILQIWQMCHTEPETIVNLDTGAENLLVIRPELEIIFEKITDAEFEFLNALVNHETFADACEEAFKISAEFSVENCFKKYVLNNTITDIAIPPH